MQASTTQQVAQPIGGDNQMVNQTAQAVADGIVTWLKARYSADPTLFNDPSAGPADQEKVAECIDELMAMIVYGTDTKSVNWEQEGDNAGAIYRLLPDGRKAMLIASLPLGPDIMGTIRNLLCERQARLEAKQNETRAALHAIDKAKSISG